MWGARTLLIGDPNLGEAARSRLSAVCEDLTYVVWDVAGRQDKRDILARIAESRWPLVISFYSDLILPPAVLAAIELPLNIHPALPHVRGVGHDVVPIVEGHATVGATLHRMDVEVDTGPIYDVCEAPLPPGQTSAALRPLNQVLSLQMLDRLSDLMSASESVEALQATLSAGAAAVPYGWGAYYSREQVAALRREHAGRLGIDMIVQAS